VAVRRRSEGEKRERESTKEEKGKNVNSGQRMNCEVIKVGARHLAWQCH
jgi:hypothetical protein